MECLQLSNIHTFEKGDELFLCINGKWLDGTRKVVKIDETRNLISVELTSNDSELIRQCKDSGVDVKLQISKQYDYHIKCSECHVELTEENRIPEENVCIDCHNRGYWSEV